MVCSYDWWEFIPNASMMLQDISNSLVNEQRSVVLLLNDDIPWYDKMYEKIRALINRSNKQTKTIECPVDILPGKYLLEEYFIQELRNLYRPNYGYEAFISNNDAIENYYIIVKIKSAAQLKEWVSFAARYEKEKKSKKAQTRCSFLFEYFPKASEKIGKIPNNFLTVKWQDIIQDYERYIYAMLSVSQEKVSRAVKEYLAEFITVVSRGYNIELISELARQGVECLKDPIKVLEKINSECTMSNGSSYNVLIDERAMLKMLWQAQVKVLYCKIEEFRNDLISKCEDRFDEDFSHVKRYGKESVVITDYHQLEIGDILYLQSVKDLGLNIETTKKAKNYKTCRDNLAHFSPADYDMVMNILEQTI